MSILFLQDGPSQAPTHQSQEVPITKPRSTSQADTHAVPEGEADGIELDPIIDGLLERLPAPGDYWAKSEREKWLQILTLTLDMIYADEEHIGPIGDAPT